MSELTLKRIKNTRLEGLYQKLILGHILSDEEIERLLACAVVFLNQRAKEIRDLGFRIILLYSLKNYDYRPLYEVSLELGYMPIADAILRSTASEPNDINQLKHVVASAFLHLFCVDGKCLTVDQGRMIQFNADSSIKDGIVVAPTSYGKTEAVLSLIADKTYKCICVLAPTKSLVTQTRSRIAKAFRGQLDALVTHPDMSFPQDGRNVFVLTQERFLRIVKKHEALSFDCLIIDEAHNLLDEGSRSELLATAITVAKKRNSQMVVRYLTPFLYQPQNLSIKAAPAELKAFQVEESIKSPNIYLVDENEMLLYDQFFNEFYETQQYFDDVFDVEIRCASSKNLVYLNRPVFAEEHARELGEHCDTVLTPLVEKFCKDLEALTHPEYYLIDCAKQGVLYHHGSMSPQVRRGVEYLFAEEPECSYLATTSTLLEGVNLPATRMFILDPRRGKRYLSSASFRNLIGRVCRFKEIFGVESDLQLLQPEIYIIRSKYTRSNANLDKYIRDVCYEGRSGEDIVKNTALSEASVLEPNETMRLEENLENFEKGIISSYEGRVATTEIGRSCFRNGLMDLDVIDIEKQMEEKARSISEKVDTPESFMRAIVAIFISGTNDAGLQRLKNEKAIRFYVMMLEWKISNLPFSEMIENLLGYWRRLEKASDEAVVYVGSKWGEIPFEDSNARNWVDISSKGKKERVNLAIVRLNEEQEFIEHKLLRFADVLHDVNLIKEEFWALLKYGTSDESIVALLNDGLSHSLIKVLTHKYGFDPESWNVERRLPNELLERMKDEDENLFLILEAVQYV